MRNKWPRTISGVPVPAPPCTHGLWADWLRKTGRSRELGMAHAWWKISQKDGVHLTSEKCETLSGWGQRFDPQGRDFKVHRDFTGSVFGKHRFRESKGPQEGRSALWHLAVKEEANGESSWFYKTKERNQRTHSPNKSTKASGLCHVGKRGSIKLEIKHPTAQKLARKD